MLIHLTRATGYSLWFERLLAELGFEVWIGDPAEIRTRRAKKQKTDSKDAQLLLKLPFITCPASQPAISPTTIHSRKLIIDASFCST